MAEYRGNGYHLTVEVTGCKFFTGNTDIPSVEMLLAQGEFTLLKRLYKVHMLIGANIDRDGFRHSLSTHVSPYGGNGITRDNGTSVPRDSSAYSKVRATVFRHCNEFALENPGWGLLSQAMGFEGVAASHEWEANSLRNQMNHHLAHRVVLLDRARLCREVSLATSEASTS